MRSQAFLVVQIILGVLLAVLILMQSKGTGLGSAFGGEMGFYHTRRGVEKMLFYFTIFISFLFLASSVLGIIL